MAETALAHRHTVMPHAERGMVIGLFGGSFNPPQPGARCLSRRSRLRRLGLDQLWWLVTPGNPLKSQKELAPLAERLAACETLAVDPRIKVTAFEKTLGTSYTAKTLEFIRARNPACRISSGSWVPTTSRGFHRWQRWQQDREHVPGCGHRSSRIDARRILSSKMARTFDYARIDEEDAGVLWQKRAPAWTFIHGPRSTLSSSAIRAAAHKP